jgi:hypothetical protein
MALRKSIGEVDSHEVHTVDGGDVEDTTRPLSILRALHESFQVVLQLRFKSYDDLDHMSAEGSSPSCRKIFLGGLRFEMGKAAVAGLAAYLSGTSVSVCNITLFTKGPMNQPTGSAVVFVESDEAARRLLSFHKRVVCEETGVWVAEDPLAMQEHMKRTAGQHTTRPHALVVEEARERQAFTTSCPLPLPPIPFAMPWMYVLLPVTHSTCVM